MTPYNIYDRETMFFTLLNELVVLFIWDPACLLLLNNNCSRNNPALHPIRILSSLQSFYIIIFLNCDPLMPLSPYKDEIFYY